MTSADDYKGYAPGSEELVHKLVEEHAGWAVSIARSVARAWNLDWQLDGLDGGAYEALLFCSRRYDPSKGVPFRAYARKRIHESSTDEARKSKSWQRGVGANTPEELTAREISARLLNVFPEMREGFLPFSDEGSGEDSIRGSIRQLLASASVLATFQEGDISSPETLAQYKQILEVIAELDPVHQAIVWGIYWNGQSMRSLAEDWKIDELAVIREHKEILRHVCSRLSVSRSKPGKKLKVRPGLRTVAQELRRKKVSPPFAQFASAVGLVIFAAALKLFERFGL